MVEGLLGGGDPRLLYLLLASSSKASSSSDGGLSLDAEELLDVEGQWLPEGQGVVAVILLVAAKAAHDRKVLGDLQLFGFSRPLGLRAAIDHVHHELFVLLLALLKYDYLDVANQ